MLPFDDTMKNSQIIEASLFTAGNIMKTNLYPQNIQYTAGNVIFYPTPFGPATRFYTDKVGGKVFLMFTEIAGPITFTVEHNFVNNMLKVEDHRIVYGTETNMEYKTIHFKENVASPTSPSAGMFLISP